MEISKDCTSSEQSGQSRAESNLCRVRVQEVKLGNYSTGSPTIYLTSRTASENNRTSKNNREQWKQYKAVSKKAVKLGNDLSSGNKAARAAKEEWYVKK